MDEGSAPAPTPPSRSAMSPVTRIVLVIALLLTGASGASCFLPWYTDQLFGEDTTHIGLVFVEGIIVLGMALLAFPFFLLVLIKEEPKSRGRLATVAVCLAFGLALVPLELFARGAYAGLRSVVVIGAGYRGWSYGLYLALAAGFACAVTGAVGASSVARRPVSAPTKLRALRKPRT